MIDNMRSVAHCIVVCDVVDAGEFEMKVQMNRFIDSIVPLRFDCFLTQLLTRFDG